jgi:methylmalonyl-CoA mutase cobalamin-binding domain/chain
LLARLNIVVLGRLGKGILSVMLTELEKAIISLDSEKAKDLCRRILSDPNSSTDDILRSIASAMDVVGQKYEVSEYFLSELFMAGEVVREVLAIIEPYYGKAVPKHIGTVLTATVRGDLHDIGKNILCTFLKSAGFSIVDLGVDVPAGKIVDVVKANGADIIGLSALLTTAVPEFRNVTDALKNAGMRDKVKVIVGGCAVNEEVAKKYGADTWARTAIEGIRICRQLVKK